MKKILIVIGTRPEAIKMAPLIKELKKRANYFSVTVCSTGQHKNMLDQVLKFFEIEPDYDFKLMSPGQDLFDVTSSVIIEIKKIISKVNPELILVHGDTTTAFASALGGFYSHVPVGHVEAGLRSHDLQNPFPEEFNRQAISKLAKWHFTPTNGAKENLIAENIHEKNIFITGNTVIDSLKNTLEKMQSNHIAQSEVKCTLNKVVGFNWVDESFILVTGHRRENFGKGFLQICAAIKGLALEFPKIKFLYPVHLNPNVKQPVTEMLSSIQNIILTEPLEYLPFITMLQNCLFVMTDSGGIQEEAPFFGKPVLVMRDVTERAEATAAGTAILTGADTAQIMRYARSLLTSNELYLKMSSAHNPYGDGHSSIYISEILEKIL